MLNYNKTSLLYPPTSLRNRTLKYNVSPFCIPDINLLFPFNPFSSPPLSKLHPYFLPKTLEQGRIEEYLSLPCSYLTVFNVSPLNMFILSFLLMSLSIMGKFTYIPGLLKAFCQE